MTYISWSIDFAFCHCQLFIYIKKWHGSGVFLSLKALAVVIFILSSHIIYFVHLLSRNRILLETSVWRLKLLKENCTQFWDSRSANYQNLESQILGLAFIAISLQILWQKFYRDVLLVVLYKTYYEFDGLPWQPKGSILEKNIQKSSETIRGMKLKLCRNVHNISLYKKYVFYYRCPCAFVSKATLFPLTYNEKGESGSLLLSHCRYFDRTFFINVCCVVHHSWSSTKCKEIVQMPHFDWLPWQLKV